MAALFLLFFSCKRLQCKYCGKHLIPKLWIISKIILIAGIFSRSSKFSVNPLLAAYFSSCIHAFILYSPAEVPEQAKNNCWRSAQSTPAQCQLLLPRMVRLLETQLETLGNVSQDSAWNPNACFKAKCKKPCHCLGWLSYMSIFYVLPTTPGFYYILLK